MCQSSDHLASSDQSPDISVVLATRDRADQLAATLSAYTHIDTAGIDWEIVVADNASTDATTAVLEEFATQLPLSHLVVDRPGKNRALNAALDQARGDFLVFTDDDAVPDHGWLKAYHTASQVWPDDAIFGGRVEPRFPHDTPEWLASQRFQFGATAFARYAPASLEGPVARHPFGPSFAVRRSAIGDLRFPVHLGPQGQSYAMGGEAGFLRALAGDGHRYIFVPKAIVQHVVRREQITDAWLMRRALNKGRGQAYLPSTKRPRRIFIRGVPLRLLLAMIRSWLRYRLMRLVGSRRQRIRHGIRYALRRGEASELARQRAPDR